MSYCRISGNCDVYAYNTGGGYMIHADIAGSNRHAAYFEPDIVRFRERMHELRRLGCRIPESAFERMDREIAERGT